MSSLSDILRLLNSVQSQDELRTISNATRDRWKVLQSGVAQKMVQDKGILPGQAVSFVHAGRKYHGTVKTINQKTCSVSVDGRAWRVSPQLLQKESSVPVQAKRSETEIMNAINDAYCGLSPENLSCDGEASRAHVQRRSRELNAQLADCFRELGHPVSETEAYDWSFKNPQPGVRRPLIQLPPVP